MARLDLKGIPIRPAWLTEFQSFIMRGNVIDLAVGIIIGAAFTSIVSSLVKDILTPILGLVVGGIDFSNIFITLKGPHLNTLADAQKAGAATLNVGVFLNAVINFLIVSFAIFWSPSSIGSRRPPWSGPRHPKRCWPKSAICCARMSPVSQE
jgi:large conductance mechanosensitive channel